MISKTDLLSSYGKLVKIIPSNYGLFCLQWGKLFPQSRNAGLLFIGRATNGWITDSHDLQVLFGNSDEAIFNRKDQMEWVNNCEGNVQGYNSRKSPFWRIVKQVSSHYYPTAWYDYVAWSNLSKIAPTEKGNPSNKLYSASLEENEKILKIEIDQLQPHAVIMLTGEDWAKDFVSFLKGTVISSIKWDVYTASLYKVANTYIIVSEHPQGKAEKEHVNAIVKLIDAIP